MNRLIIATAALALATPVFAQNTGINAQTSTSLEVRKHFAADEGGNEDTILLNGSGITAEGAEIAAEADANANMDNPSLDVTQEELLNSGDDTVVNGTAATIFLKIDKEDSAGAVN